jgi:hypothetical protein
MIFFSFFWAFFFYLLLPLLRRLLRFHSKMRQEEHWTKERKWRKKKEGNFAKLSKCKS